MRDHLRLYINRSFYRIEREDAFATLSDFLRQRLRPALPGTKVVCAEGDCGACTVLVGRVVDGRIKYSAVTSCILLMFQLDGTHVITVEGLKQDGELNPIQESLVACHGTQCGFCTPGFVVALHGLLESSSPCSAEQIRRGLVGNLCRCTGYDSIVNAAMQADTSRLKTLEATYPAVDLLPVLNAARLEAVSIDTEGRSFFKASSVEQALKYRAENPAATVVSGATDVGVLHSKNVRRLDKVLYVGDLDELRQSRVEAGAINIGAAATIAELESITRSIIPELSGFLAWFGSPLIKNGGTIAGNLVTGSPIGDTLPAMIVLGAEIELANATGTRRVPIREFYTGYRSTVMRSDEIVTRIRIPIPKPDTIFRLYKVSRRKDLDISTFSATIAMDVADGKINDATIAFGGVGPMVLRMEKTEAALRGQTPTLERFEQAAAIAEAEVTPISDVRGSEEYRRQLAGNILLRFWQETFSADAKQPATGMPD